MSTSDNQSIDMDLIDLEEVVLRQAGYVVEAGITNGMAYLLAEDKDNVIAASAVLTADDVQLVEPALTRVLVDRLSDRTVEAKKWDGYVVILSSSHPDDDATRALFNITYNLNQVRRVIRVGIEPTTASVSRGLRAVLPLSQTHVEEILTDPMEALRSRLVADGLNPDQVDEAILGFGPDYGDISEDVFVEEDEGEEELLGGEEDGNDDDLD
jgi:hypothetical protein